MNRTPKTQPMQIACLEEVSFAYDDMRILDGASLSIGQGECVALIGPNGSGKSTVAELICALLVPDSGVVAVMGLDTSAIDGDAEMLELRGSLGYALQNPDDQFVEPIVLDEVAFGPSNLCLAPDEVIERVHDALEQADALEFLNRSVNALSGGEKQRIAIADALAMRPRLLILDEPTSMLDRTGREAVIEVIRRAKGQGVAMLLLTHSVAEAELADRVLRIEGKRIRESSIDEMRGEVESARQRLAEKASARSAASELRSSMHENPGASILDTTSEPTTDAPIVRIDDVSYAYDPMRSQIMGMFAGDDDPSTAGYDDANAVSCHSPASTERESAGSNAASTPTLALDQVSLDVMRGEALAIRGANGSGKSTLLQLMNGLLKPTSGTVLVNGVDTSTKDGANAARRTVGLCGQFPERTFFGQTARDEIGFGPKNLGLPKPEIESRVEQAALALGIDERVLDSSPFELSGGEQRKVAIASILSMRPEMLVLDEPCSGLDIAAHALVLEALLDMKGSGSTIVLASHDDDDIEILADRIFELR